MRADELVPGRECGDCRVCCIVPGIDTREAQKDTGSACRNLCGTGCAIYETRPGACRTFYCAWRALPGLGENWRPDLSGVLAQLVTVRDQPGVCLTLIADPMKTVRQDWFVGFMAATAVIGTPLLLALPGPRGRQSAKLVASTDELCRAAAGGTHEQVRQLLRRMVKQLRATPPQPLPLQNSGNDMSGP